MAADLLHQSSPTSGASAVELAQARSISFHTGNVVNHKHNRLMHSTIKCASSEVGNGLVGPGLPIHAGSGRAIFFLREGGEDPLYAQC